MPGLWIKCYLEAAAGVELDDEEELVEEELDLSELLEEPFDLSDDFVSPAGLLVEESDEEVDEFDESALELDELLLALFAASRLSLR